MNKEDKDIIARELAMKDISDDSVVNYVRKEKRIVKTCSKNCKECKCNGIQ